MAAPPVGTKVSVLTSAMGYPMRLPGIVMANLESWNPEAENDMPEPMDSDRAHILMTGISAGNPVHPFLPNAMPGTGADQYTVVPQSADLHIRRDVLALPSLDAGIPSDQEIAWTSPMPGPDYGLELTPGQGLAENVTLAVVDGTRTASGVTARVTSPVSLAAGALLDVTAYAL